MMLGTYDFCGHYEWTFAWLRQKGGTELLREYWDRAIHRDSQTHAKRLISAQGIVGMKQYWSRALKEEAAGYAISASETVFRIDMHDCPSKGFLLRNGLHQDLDYCNHCMGWMAPMMKDAGFEIDHQHNHCGQCWWEIRRNGDKAPVSEPGAFAGEKDVRLSEGWRAYCKNLDTFLRVKAVEREGNPTKG